MTAEKRVLVIGGTGTIGQPVANALHKAGYTVSVLTRNLGRAKTSGLPKVDFMEGSIEDENVLRQALQGCYGVHISLQSGQSAMEQERIQHQGTARIARIAAEMAVQHLTYVSGYLVSDQFSYIPAEKAKLNAEKAIQASGVTYTIFRPTYFMDIIPRFLQNGRLSIFGKQPHPIHFLAVADFACFVSSALTEPQAANRTFYVRGPQPMTFSDAFTLYRDIVDTSIKVSSTPFWVGSLLNRFAMKGELTETLALLRATEQVGEIGDYSLAETIFGPATTTLEDWCHNHKSMNRV